MATVDKKTKVVLHLDDGSSRSLTLPEYVNENLLDPNSNLPLYSDVFPAIKAAYETDAGAHVHSADFQTVMTRVQHVIDGWTGNDN